jgi:hypothetical protein
MLRRVLARLARVLDLARLFDLPDRHPDRMIAESIVLYVGLGIIIAVTLWNHWKAAQHTLAVAVFPSSFRPIPSHQHRPRDWTAPQP